MRVVYSVYRLQSERRRTEMSKNIMGEYFQLPNPGLSSYLNHVENGQPENYRTPFYKGKTPEEVLDSWNSILLSIASDWPTLYDFECDLAKKVGPMSVMKPINERMEDIESYYESIFLDSIPISPKAILSALDEWKQVRSLSLRDEQLTALIMKKSTNSGSPYFTKRRNVLTKTLPIDMTHDGYFLGKDREYYKYIATLGWRGQEGGPTVEDVKQRVVWMFPFAINIKELQVYQPLIEMFQRHNLVPAWIGMDAVDQGVTNLFDTKDPEDFVICTDFTKYDQHFNTVCQSAAYACLNFLLKQGAESQSWLKDVFPIKYNIPLLYGWGQIRTGPHGMGSGSGGTNVDETLVHRCLQHEAALSNRCKLNPHSQCLGDDGILSYPGCTADDVVRTYSSHGLPMNPDKQYVSKQDCVYLRRWHHISYRRDGICVGVYSTNRAIGRLMHQERYYDSDTWNEKMVALRQLSILENVKYHPLGERFIDFCMEGDKYRLGIDIPGFLENIVTYAEEAIDYMPDFLGYTKSQSRSEKDFKSRGIADWWVVKYLKSKA